jgi:protein-tyrosine kinase
MSRIQDALRSVERSKELQAQNTFNLHSADSRQLLDLPTPSVQDGIPPLSSPNHAAMPGAVRTLQDLSETPWKPDRASLFSFEDLSSRKAAEEFRSLRTRLLQMRDKQPLRSLLVTSAVPQEGKSYVSANLARALALQAGCRVLLVDADLRGRALHKMFGASANPGVAEYLLYERDELQILQRGKADNLFLIPSGRPAAGPAELLGNGQFCALLSRLAPLFDWIVVDSPSVTPFSDACSLANCCDGVLMVVRSRATTFDLARKAIERFPEEALIGVVLNEIETVVSKETTANRSSSRMV